VRTSQLNRCAATPLALVAGSDDAARFLQVQHAPNVGLDSQGGLPHRRLRRRARALRRQREQLHPHLLRHVRQPADQQR
jgi:hypothetical protein